MYKDTWEASIGVNLLCRKDLSNRHDPPVAVPGYRIILGVIAHGWNYTSKRN